MRKCPRKVRYQTFTHSLEAANLGAVVRPRAIPRKRPRDMKMRQGTPTIPFYGRIEEAAERYLCSEAARLGYSKARFISMILLEHKMRSLRPQQSPISKIDLPAPPN